MAFLSKWIVKPFGDAKLRGLWAAAIAAYLVATLNWEVSAEVVGNTIAIVVMVVASIAGGSKKST